MPDNESRTDEDDVAWSGRVWSVALGSKEGYPADVAAVEAYETIFPDFRAFARASRAFLIRSVRYLAGPEVGLDQFLDIGAGLPTDYNTNEAAQGINPRAKIVFADHDPIAVRKGQAMLISTPQGVCDYVQADILDTAGVLAAARQTLDLTRPVGLIFSDMLGHVTDYSQAHGAVRRLVDAMPSGSHAMVSHASNEDRVQVAAQEQYNAAPGVVPYILRSREEIDGFFEGTEKVRPGLVQWFDWRPDPTTPPGPPSAGYGAVARIP